MKIPEYHLRSRSKSRRPDVDLPRIDLLEAVATFEWPKIDLSSVDVGKVVTGMAAAAHIGRRARRPRWPMALGGLILASLAGWAILSNEALRARLAGVALAIRERITAARSNLRHRREIDRADPIAFSAAATAPLQTAPYVDGTTVAATGYPAGLGSNNGDGLPALEEAGSRA